MATAWLAWRLHVGFVHVFVCHVSFDSAVKETAISHSLGGRMLSELKVMSWINFHAAAWYTGPTGSHHQAGLALYECESGAWTFN